MAILSEQTELTNTAAYWGHWALGLEFLSIVGGHAIGHLMFADHGPHPVLVALLIVALISGVIALVFAIVGVVRDTAKWPGVLAILLFPLTVIYTV